MVPGNGVAFIAFAKYLEKFAAKADESLWDGRKSTIESFHRFLSTLHGKLCESDYGKKVAGKDTGTKGVAPVTEQALDWPEVHVAPLRFSGGEDHSLLLVSGVSGGGIGTDVDIISGSSSSSSSGGDRSRNSGQEMRIFRKGLEENEPLHPYHYQRREQQQHSIQQQRQSPVTPWVDVEHGEVTGPHDAVMVTKIPPNPRTVPPSTLASMAVNRYQAEDNYDEESKLQLVKLDGWSTGGRDDLLGAIHIHRPQTATSISSKISPRVRRQRAIAASQHHVVRTEVRAHAGASTSRHRPQSGQLKLRGQSREASASSSSSSSSSPKRRSASRKGKRRPRILRNTDFTPPPRDSWGRIKRLDHVPKGFFRKRMVLPKDSLREAVSRSEGLELKGVCV